MSGGELIDDIQHKLSIAVTDTFGYFAARLDELRQHQEQIEKVLATIEHLLADKNSDHLAHKKEWYTPAEAAKLLGKASFTIREWCRYQRINARKRPSGRGSETEWEISAEEIERYRNHGLLPLPKKY